MDIRDTVRMANQIGDFFKSYPEQEALDGIAEHINKFWEPRMRRQLFEKIDAGNSGLSDLVLEAAKTINRPAASSTATAN